MGYSPRKDDVGKAGPVEGAVVDLAVGFDAQGEALIERRFRLRRMGIVGVAGADVLVENVPVPEFAVAAEVELAGAEAADRHSDQGGFGAAVDLRLAAGGQDANPVGRQFFVEGDESPRLLRRERAGHEAGLGDEREGSEAQELEKFTAVRGIGGTLGFHAMGLTIKTLRPLVPRLRLGTHWLRGSASRLIPTGGRASKAVRSQAAARERGGFTAPPSACRS